MAFYRNFSLFSFVAKIESNMGGRKLVIKLLGYMEISILNWLVNTCKKDYGQKTNILAWRIILFSDGKSYWVGPIDGNESFLCNVNK